MGASGLRCGGPAYASGRRPVNLDQMYRLAGEILDESWDGQSRHKLQELISIIMEARYLAGRIEGTKMAIKMVEPHDHNLARTIALALLPPGYDDEN